MTDCIQRRRFLWQVIVSFGMGFVGRSLALAGTAPGDPLLRRTPSGDLLETVSEGSLPSFAVQGGPRIVEAYRYAADHGEILQYIPCFCGCVNIGHRHNADCYVAERPPGGRITFTSHGAM